MTKRDQYSEATLVYCASKAFIVERNVTLISKNHALSSCRLNTEVHAPSFGFNWVVSDLRSDSQNKCQSTVLSKSGFGELHYLRSFKPSFGSSKDRTELTTRPTRTYSKMVAT